MKLGFKLEPGSPDVIVFDVGGRRPATAAESVLWAALEADAQALADMRTLDEWRKNRPANKHRSVDETNESEVRLNEQPSRRYMKQRGYYVTFTGPTPEAARAKAAAWAREQATRPEAKANARAVAD